MLASMTAPLVTMPLMPSAAVVIEPPPPAPPDDPPPAADPVDRAYHQLQAAFREPAARRELGRAQQLWLAGRERTCVSPAHPGAQARCETAMSRRRAAELTELLARAKGRE
jgi:hypothetical protein